jgi:hypothetical protein
MNLEPLEALLLDIEEQEQEDLDDCFLKKLRERLKKMKRKLRSAKVDRFFPFIVKLSS